MKDETDKMSGKAKEMAGKATHNKKLETKGKIQHDVADVRQKAKNVAHHVSDKLHD